MLVSVASTPVTRIWEEAVKVAETAETTKTAKIAKAVETTDAGRDGKESKGDENLRSNLAQVLYIQYSVTFQKKFVHVLALLDLGSEVNTIYSTFV